MIIENRYYLRNTSLYFMYKNLGQLFLAEKYLLVLQA